MLTMNRVSKDEKLLSIDYRNPNFLGPTEGVGAVQNWVCWQDVAALWNKQSKAIQILP